jgi:hypothetical protein
MGGNQLRCKRRFGKFDCHSIVVKQINAKIQQELKTTSPSGPRPVFPKGKNNKALCENRVRSDPATVTPLPARTALTRFV